jgi:hypothetical protein
MHLHGDTPVDGNAVAGLLREVFALDVTTAALVCAGCGCEAQLGAVRVFGGTMGAVFRCDGCDDVVFRLVRTPDGYWLDMRGMQRLFARKASA